MKHVRIPKLIENVSMKDFKSLLNEKRVENWLRKYDLKIPIEALICSAQEQAIRTNYVKYHIDKSVDSPSCRRWGETVETSSHIVSECSKLGQR